MSKTNDQNPYGGKGVSTPVNLFSNTPPFTFTLNSNKQFTNFTEASGFPSTKRSNGLSGQSFDSLFSCNTNKTATNTTTSTSGGVSLPFLSTEIKFSNFAGTSTSAETVFQSQNNLNKDIPLSANLKDNVSEIETKEVSSDYLFKGKDSLLKVDDNGVTRKVNNIKYIVSSEFKPEYEIAWLLKAISCIDLTTLSGDDTESNVSRLCYKAVHPLSNHLLELMKNSLPFVEGLTTAAVCVYPTKVGSASEKINCFKASEKVNIASVATGFPSGQYPLSTKVEEIKYCIAKGANEIDIVISRDLVIANKWNELHDEIKKLKDACGGVHMKTILATGECGSLENVYKASMVAMIAGSDFIKTSTGKESTNATLEVGVVMCRAIRDYYEDTKKKVGLKPAGGIRTSFDALSWLVLVKEILGKEWLNPKLFRIGASGLLGDIEKRLFYLLKGYKPTKEYFLSS